VARALAGLGFGVLRPRTTSRGRPLQSAIPRGRSQLDRPALRAGRGDKVQALFEIRKSPNHVEPTNDSSALVGHDRPMSRALCSRWDLGDGPHSTRHRRGPDRQCRDSPAGAAVDVSPGHAAQFRFLTDPAPDSSTTDPRGEEIRGRWKPVSDPPRCVSSSNRGHSVPRRRAAPGAPPRLRARPSF